MKPVKHARSHGVLLDWARPDGATSVVSAKIAQAQAGARTMFSGEYEGVGMLLPPRIVPQRSGKP